MAMDSLPLLDVLYANQFEREHFTPELNKQTEENFYRGAPPIWLNFYISEQSSDAGTKLIKRDGYDALMQQIQQSRKCPAISTVKLFHQPGCGGTTLAMQVMWDVRKTFRCAVLRDSTSDMTTVAKKVVQLFRQSNQKTVLLLLNDEQVLENLEERIKDEIAEQKIHKNIKGPVVVLFCCMRKNENLQGKHVVLERSLSDTEKTKFDEKKDEISKKFADVHEQFHGFNILQSNFSEAHVRQVCSAAFNVLKANKKPKTHLATFLALLNAYAPGSYVLESQCLDFLKQKESASGDDSLEDRLKPFSQLIITFQQDSSSEKRVRMAHSMIAQSCTELMAEAGVTRSDTATNFIKSFCRDEVPSYLLGFLKHMLTKREEKKEENPSNSPEMQEEKEKFSRLILDIQKMEDEAQCTSLLKVASNRFQKNPFFPQALARFYYLEIKDYEEAENWAKRAKERYPKNSFIADTLGQVHKNHLKNKGMNQRTGGANAKPSELLRLAQRAIEAFKHEEELAENEHEKDVIGDRNTQVSHFHNTRGQFGYLQVCNLLYDQLVGQNEIWKDVLTKKRSLGSVLTSPKSTEFNDLINSLKDDVKRKCDFLNAYLTYSKPGLQREDPPDCRRTVTSCYKTFVEGPQPDLVLEIKKKVTDNVWKSPESYIAAIFKQWPTDNKPNSPNLMHLIKKADDSYEATYANNFRSRYLRPLFYLGKDDTPDNMLPANSIHSLLEKQDGDFINYMINKDKIFRDLRVQEKLLRFDGKVKDYSVIARVGKHDIKMKANMQESTWVPRDVSFYVGFTMKGPVAFGIQNKPNKNGPPSTCESCGSVGQTKDIDVWIKLKPVETIRNDITTYSFQSVPGWFQCSVSALRWVCTTPVSFTYQFKSWEDHQEDLSKVCCSPGGPLLEIVETKGKLDEVYLPHWVCVDGLTAVPEKFAVFHTKEAGNFLEQVSEVKSSHVKLFHPSFPINGVLIRSGTPARVHCNVLICQTKEKFLTLQIHVKPSDPALQQELEQREKTRGSIIIQKPNSVLALTMQASFSLTCDAEAAIVSPAQIQFRDKRGPTTFFTVSIKDANSDFMLTLLQEGKSMWSCEIKKDDYKLNQQKKMHEQQ